MAGDSIHGNAAKVAKGSTKILGIGNWTYDIPGRQVVVDSEFQDTHEKYKFGIIPGGTISFSGNYKKDDTTGQDVIIDAWDANTNLTDLRFYVDNTSYYEACQTTGYLTTVNTTGNNTVPSSINILSRNITVDKGALNTISFTGQVSGLLVLV